METCGRKLETAGKTIVYNLVLYVASDWTNLTAVFTSSTEQLSAELRPLDSSVAEIWPKRLLVLLC